MSILVLNHGDTEKVLQGAKKMHTFRNISHHFTQDERLCICDAEAGYASKAIRTTKIVSIKKVFVDTNKTILLDNKLLNRSNAEAYVKVHGFNTVDAFIDDLRATQGLPLSGTVIEWL